MAKRGSDDWDDDALFPELRSRVRSRLGLRSRLRRHPRSMILATFFWFAIWGVTNFEPWVGFGLFFAWAGSVGLLGGKKDDDLWEDDDDDRGYRPVSGSESDEAARARLSGEPLPPPAPTPLLHRQVIADAAPARTRLEAAASVAEGELGARLRNMVAKVRDVETGLESDPSRLSDVQRLFTYYLPATADLLSARGALAGSAESARLTEIDAMIGKLDLAYNDFADRLKGHDARSLEIDLKLLDRALDEEFVLKTKG